nr:immunoglobulin heavy chain junction region [Macaca mulatta]
CAGGSRRQSENW